MPNKNSKKARRAAQGFGKEVSVERGFIVVHAETGHRIYLGHPEGVDEAEANRLAEGLAAPTKVVPVVSPE